MAMTDCETDAALKSIVRYARARCNAYPNGPLECDELVAEAWILMTEKGMEPRRAVNLAWDRARAAADRHAGIRRAHKTAASACCRCFTDLGLGAHGEPLGEQDE